MEILKIYLFFLEKGTRTSTGAFTASEYEKRILAYSHLNKFLMGFIDNVGFL